MMVLTSDCHHSAILCYCDLDRAGWTPPPWLKCCINAASACPQQCLRAYWYPDMKGLSLILLGLLLMLAVGEGKQWIQTFSYSVRLNQTRHDMENGQTTLCRVCLCGSEQYNQIMISQTDSFLNHCVFYI